LAYDRVLTQLRLGANLILMTNFRNVAIVLIALGVMWPGGGLGPHFARADEDGSVFQPMRSVKDQQRLNTLYDELSEATDKRAAETVANKILEIWTRSGSDTIDLLTRRARVALEAADDETTEDLLDAVVEIAPNFVEGWNRRATYYFTKKDFARAMADVQRVLALDPRHFGALSGLGAMLEDAGQHAAALNVYRKALKVHPYLPGAQRAADDLQVEVEGRQI